MRKFFSQIDTLLRGGYTRPEDLREGRIQFPARSLFTGALVLGAIYGLFMGMYAATRPDASSVTQLFATAIKVPLLFLLTLAVTFPSLYVLSALAGSRLRFLQTLRLLLVAVAINLALLASLGPVLGFFTLSTQSYPFMVLLNVIIFAISGMAGLAFLRRSLDHVFTAHTEAVPTPPPSVEPTHDNEDGEEAEVEVESAPRFATPAYKPAPKTSGQELSVFRGWLVVYGVVGAQMGWVLRPFIGNPDLPFTWFREREGNFFQAVVDSVVQLFS